MMNSKFLLGLFLVVVVAGGGWWVYNRQSLSDLANISANSPAKLSDSQVDQLVARVGQFMVLPSDETPSVAIIRDVESLSQQQSFYRDAKNGDVLVVYSTRAIIYDPKA